MTTDRDSSEACKAAIAARFAEIAVLTGLVEDLEARLVQLTAQHDDLVQTIERLKQNEEQASLIRSNLEDENRRLKAHIHDLLNSTSWRMTSPLRSAVTVWRTWKRP
ncbi:hypothetical protein [Paracoccus sp. (in: a-proteobacteria)]|uniref:hypothetical protein n=1 Tax=Paracoccus sp. TaxID=267 RepID=UPI00396C9482